jgi:hypothetical protein
MIWTGENQRTRRENCPGTTLSTTNPTWTAPGTNPGLRCERPATNRRPSSYLSQKTVIMFLLLQTVDSEKRRKIVTGTGRQWPETSWNLNFRWLPLKFLILYSHKMLRTPHRLVCSRARTFLREASLFISVGYFVSSENEFLSLFRSKCARRGRKTKGKKTENCINHLSTLHTTINRKGKCWFATTLVNLRTRQRETEQNLNTTNCVTENVILCTRECLSVAGHWDNESVSVVTEP